MRQLSFLLICFFNVWACSAQDSESFYPKFKWMPTGTLYAKNTCIVKVHKVEFLVPVKYMEHILSFTHSEKAYIGDTVDLGERYTMPIRNGLAFLLLKNKIRIIKVNDQVVKSRIYCIYAHDRVLRKRTDLVFADIYMVKEEPWAESKLIFNYFVFPHILKRD